MNNKLVILSGGADSAICAAMLCKSRSAIAKKEGEKVHAITSDISQIFKCDRCTCRLSLRNNLLRNIMVQPLLTIYFGKI